MADDPDGADDCSTNDLELLRSGNFADVKIVCNDRSWNCHRAILVPRSVWFRKALAGPFKEATDKQVNLDEENPHCVEHALNFIYGRGLDIESSVPKEHFMEHCVDLWHVADFLLLTSLKSSVEKEVHNYCDKQMKKLCTKPHKCILWENGEDASKLSPWALDFVGGLRGIYKWKIECLKLALLEFTWVGRKWTLHKTTISALLDHLKDVPTFTADLLSHFSAANWINTAVWAPDRREDRGTSITKCGLCNTKISWSKTSVGQVADPFTIDWDNCKFTRGWCRDCAAGDAIPWRV